MVKFSYILNLILIAIIVYLLFDNPPKSTQEIKVIELKEQIKQLEPVVEVKATQYTTAKKKAVSVAEISQDTAVQMVIMDLIDSTDELIAVLEQKNAIQADIIKLQDQVFTENNKLRKQNKVLKVALIITSTVAVMAILL
jgi:leucyl-tRNA synthetase